MSPYSEFEAIEFEDIFKNLPQKYNLNNDPIVASGRSAGDQDLEDRALATGPSNGAIVDNVIESFRLGQREKRPVFSLLQTGEQSIPNCNSFECNNGMVSGGPDNQNEAVPANWGKQNVHWGVEVEPEIYRLH